MKVLIMRNKLKLFWPLYPTWFRWKSCYVLSKINNNNYFISHMVQMKVGLLGLLCKTWKPLYPTWFRWKGSCTKEFWHNDILYIPHGSDESIVEYQNNRSDVSFISHMVQMKVLRKLLRRLVLKTFISHMVQMKEFVEAKFSFSLLTLYPTWFRWKYSKKK